MPRVLIEMGFISNTIEGNKLNSEEGQDEIAKAIADAVISYKKEYYGNGEMEVFEERPVQKINEKPIIETITPDKAKVNPQPETVTKNSKQVGDVALPLFKVQLSATRKRVELVPINFKGLNNVSVTYEGGVYKYMFGETTDYNEAKKYLSEAKAKGYASAFLIAFKNGAKVNIQDVIN